MRDFLWRSGYYLLGIIAVGATIWFLWTNYQQNAPITETLDDRLPAIFREPWWMYWVWFVGGLTGAVVLGLRFRKLWRRSDGDADGGEEDAGSSADLRAAWKAIQTHLIHLRRGGEEPWFLVLAPSPVPGESPSSWTRALLGAGGLRPDERRPTDSGPLHAYVSDRGIFLEYGFGGDEPGMDSAARTSQAVALARLLDPVFGQPPKLRGVLIAFPARWIGNDEGHRWIDQLDWVLQGMEQVLAIRYPLDIAVVDMETVPGFTHYARLKASQVKAGEAARIGFSIEDGADDLRTRIRRAYRDFEEFTARDIQILMMTRPLELDVNCDLERLLARFAQWRIDLLGALEKILLDVGRDDEREGHDPGRDIGCYFTTTESGPDSVFAQGILERTIDERVGEVRWAGWARRLDRTRKRLAVGLAVGAIPAFAPAWIWALGVGSLSIWGWLALAALIAFWAGFLAVGLKRHPGSWRDLTRTKQG